MKTVISGLSFKDLRVGDRVLGFEQSNGWVNRDFVVAVIYADEIQDGDGYTLFDHHSRSNWKIEREMMSVDWGYETFVTPVVAGPKKTTPDWPETCPRCHRAQSAVILFSSVDCRHGCFK